MTSSRLSATAVTRRFGRRKVVDGVSFDLAAGESLAVFGPNGAGKTTLLRMLGGLLKPDEGTVMLAGTSLAGNTLLRGGIGMISHRTMLYPALTAVENVEFAARLYGKSDATRAARRALERLGIEQGTVPVRLLSRGMQQRVSIARALVNEPLLLLADEPYTGLDVSGAHALTGVLRDLRQQGAALVLVTHQLHEGLEIADKVAVMVNGSFVRYQSSAEIRPDDYAAEYRGLVGANA